MYQLMLTQGMNENLMELAQRILWCGVAPREVGVSLYGVSGFTPPVSGEIIVAIQSLKAAGLII